MAATPRHRKCRLPQIAFVIVLVTGTVVLAVNFSPDKALALLDWVVDHPKEGSALFMALYVAGVVFMLPAMVMAMAAGAIFGMGLGTFLSWLGSSVGQVIAFVAGRYVFQDIVVSYLAKQFPKWTAIDAAMTREGWKLVTLLRLSPIAPWNVLNYALSVTSVPLLTYTVASSISILPYLLLFVYFGSMARNLADIFTGDAKMDTKTTIVMASMSGVALVGLVWYATHMSRKAMGDALREHAEELPIEINHDEEVVNLLGGSNGTMQMPYDDDDHFIASRQYRPEAKEHTSLPRRLEMVAAGLGSADGHTRHTVHATGNSSSSSTGETEYLHHHTRAHVRSGHASPK